MTIENKAIENMDKLPDHCAALNPSTKQPILILKGEIGYHPAPSGLNVDDYNKRHGISKAQQQAMLIGSMFGWEVPGADPDNEINQGVTEQ